MKKKFIGIGTLALLQIAIVGNLQPLSANAFQGFALPLLYGLAVLGFFAPCVLMVAELATTHPQTGGAYIWVEKAFGKRAGFFTVSLLWVANLLWYPSLFAFIATNFAYLFSPGLAKNKIFIASVSTGIFWVVTLLNYFGVRLSSVFSALSAVVGVMTPMLLIMGAGLAWYWLGHPLAISFHASSLLFDFNSSHNLSYVLAIVMSLFGMELSAVHAGNVLNPRRDYPKSLLISSGVLLLCLLGSELAIAIILPIEKMNIVSSLLEALILFFEKTHLSEITWPVLFLVFLGSLGSAAAWMLSTTRSMFVACQHNHVVALLQRKNQYDSPSGVLLFEAVIFTLASSVILLFPRITDSFWFLLDIASQISLIYYCILFLSCVRLRDCPVEREGFIIPGGKKALWVLMGLGVVTSLMAFFMGFVAPSELSKKEAVLFDSILLIGLFLSLSLPFLLLRFGKSLKHPAVSSFIENGSGPKELPDASFFNLAQFLLARQKNNVNRTALIVVDEVGKKRTVSYQALDEKVRMAASQIKALNFPKQAVIALQSDEVEEFIIFFLALNWLGLVPVPLILGLNQNELEFILRDCQAKAFFCFRQEESEIALPHDCQKITRNQIPRVKDRCSMADAFITKKEDPAFIFYTSGSSGLPKGVLHAQRVILGRLPSLHHWLTLNEKDIVMQTDNLCWTYSMFTGLLDPLFVGATAVIVSHSHLSSLAENEMTAEAWFKIIQDCQVTVMASTPDIYCMLLAAKNIDSADGASLRQAGCAGAFLKEEVQANWVEHFGFPIYIALGMSEISTFISTGPKVAYRSQALGKIQPGRKVAILSINEQGHSPGCGEQGILAVHKTELGLMLDYVGLSARNKAHWRGDWFLTQDKVSYDDEQYIYYHGRIDSIVKVGGGFRVSLLAIEEKIKQFSDIDNAVCDLIYEKKTGSDQLIAYLVSSKTDINALLELYKYLKDQLSDYELPLYFYYVEKFPLTNRGKIARYKISESRIIKKYRVVEGELEIF